MKIKLKTTEQKLFYLLSNFKEARKNNSTLIAYYLRYIENVRFNNKDFEKLKKISYETIRRTRAKMKNEKKIFAETTIKKDKSQRKIQSFMQD